MPKSLDTLDARQKKLRNLQDWTLCYAAEYELAAFRPYDMVVLDGDAHPDVAALRNQGKLVLGYVSLAEVVSHKPYFKQASEAGLFLNKNEVWGGSVVDVRLEAWAPMVHDVLLPKVFEAGFDGIFIDTFDSPIDLELRAPSQYGGMQQACVDLVASIKQRHPEHLIVVNRAIDILPALAPHIDGSLAESLCVHYDFGTKSHRRYPEYDYRGHIAPYLSAKAANQHLKMLSLDYWTPEEVEDIKEIYKVQRQNDFAPYVSTVALDQVFAEPKTSAMAGLKKLFKL